MLKKYVICLFLATAYTVLLAHNFTPHQHNIEQTAHHHDNGHDHPDDDHDDGKEKESFHFFQHIGESEIEYISGQFIRYDVQKKSCATVFEQVAIIVLDHLEKPPIIVPLLRTGHLTIQQTRPYFFHLKAPPAFTT